MLWQIDLNAHTGDATTIMNPAPSEDNGRSSLHLPEDLRSQGLHIRAETADDMDFLRTLYLSVRWPELAPQTGLTISNAQPHHQYQANYTGIECLIVMVEQHPAGRIYLHQSATELRIVDISLIPEFRARGIGAALLRSTCQRAVSEAIPVTLNVEQTNPAWHLYSRLGFKKIGTADPYWKMQWDPANDLEA